MRSRPNRPAQQESATPNRSTPLEAALQALRTVVGLMLGFSFFANVLRLTIPLYMLQVVDRVLSSGNLDTLLYLTLIAIAALVTGGAINAVVRTLQNRMGSWLDAELIEPVLRSSVDGRLTQRSMGMQPLRDLAQLRNYYGGQAFATLFDLPWVPVFLVVIYMLHTTLGVVSTLFAIVLLALAILQDQLTRKAQERAGRETSQLNESVSRGVQNGDLIHAMGIMPAFLNSASAASERARSAHDAVNERGALLLSLIRTIRQAAQITILATGAYLVLDAEATTGLMIAGSILLNLALSPLDQASAAWRGWMMAREAQARLRRQLSVTDETVVRGRAALSQPRGELALDRAMYIPQGRARPVIKPLSFSIAPGEMIGVIGTAGAGKSALCRLLVGLVPPQSGLVQLDGVDLHEWIAAGLGRHVGYLPQDVSFFAGTIADNIARLEPDSPQRASAVREAAEMVGLHSSILNLPQGYETELDSAFLSRSELQRVALARAFYRTPQLIVLDEPASFLDRSGEAALVDALSTLKEQGCTLVIVNQRPALMRLCDKLILLRDGVMEAFGEPETVLEKLRKSDRLGEKQRGMLHIAHG